MSAYSVNCETTSAATADLEQRQVRPAIGVAKDAQLGRLAGEIVGDRVGVVRPDPQQDDEARPYLADDGSLDEHPRAGRALEERPHGWLGGGMTPCSAMKAVRHASASCSCLARAAAKRSTTTASAEAGTSRS